MKTVVIVSAVRTPIGSFQGTLSAFTAPELGAAAIKGAIEKIQISQEDVNEVIMGNVLTAGIGQAPARQAALAAGLPDTVETITINKVCGSGLKAVMLAAQAIALGDADIVIAGGMESMTNAPYLLPNARSGFRMGNVEAVDSMIYDGLTNPYNQEHMGKIAELCAEACHIDRTAQDEYSIRSYKLANESIEKGRFKNEIVPVSMTDRKGNIIVVEEDEEPGKVKYDKIPSLKPVFQKDGSITAANASSINDGAAAMLLMSEEKAIELGFKPLVKIIGYSSAAKAPEWFTIAPLDVIKKTLARTSLSIDQIDLFEINEAFAVVALAAKNELDIPLEKLNVNGGAVALGHPIGASGARILVTLIHALHTYNKKTGMAAICIGGGEAAGMIVERV